MRAGDEFQICLVDRRGVPSNRVIERVGDWLVNQVFVKQTLWCNKNDLHEKCWTDKRRYNSVAEAF